MDSRFHPLMMAAWESRLAEFVSLLDRNPELVQARSTCSHPTLLQFVVLDGGQGKIHRPEGFLRALMERGAELGEPFVAAASIGSRAMAEFLLEEGADVESGAPWTALEESVYWAHGEFSAWLRSDHGARVRSLRAAAGLGDVAAMERFLSASGPEREADIVRFPWGSPSTEPQDVLDQALVVAAKNGRAPAVARLLDAGANASAFPPGVHEGGTALHLAAMFGRREVVDLLLDAGVDPSLRDPEHQAAPSGWAQHGGHTELAEHLRPLEGG